MEELFAALTHHFDESEIAAHTNGLWAHPAPPPDKGGPECPYVTWQYISNAPEETSHSFDELPLIQLTVFSADKEPNEVARLGAYLRAAFDKARFSIIGSDTIYVRREADRLVPDPDGGWQYSADYRIYTSRRKP